MTIENSNMTALNAFFTNKSTKFQRSTHGGVCQASNWAGLVLPRPREEKNDHNSASVGVWNSYKTDISNGYMGLQNFFLPYIKKKKK